MLDPKKIVIGPQLQGRRALFISDLHGELQLLDQLLVQAEYRPGEDLLFLLGDLIEKGSDSLGTLRRVMALAQQPGVIVIQGNNDRIETLFDPQLSRSAQWGYLQTRRSLIHQMAESLSFPLAETMDFSKLHQKLRKVFSKELDFLSSLPLLISGPGYAAAHSSLQDPCRPECNDEARLLKDNDFLLSDTSCFDIPVIVGHMPTVALDSEKGCCSVHQLKERNLFAIDGGCGMHRHGQLNALVIENGNFDQYQVFSADLLEKRTVIRAQEGNLGEETVFVRYFESAIDVQGETGEFLTVRHQASGRLLEIPRSALRKREDGDHCFNSTSVWLPLSPQDQVSVIQDYSDRVFCKKDGLIGWVRKECLTLKL